MSRLLKQEEYEKTRAFRFSRWLSGEKDPYVGRVEMRPQRPEETSEQTIRERMRDSQMIRDKVYDVEHNKWLVLFRRVYMTAAVLFCVCLAGLLLYMVSWLPAAGEADKAVNNEVPARYIESGLQETGAVNIVTGMILDYRAFDTFGESNVLFAATTTVLILLHARRKRDGQAAGQGDAQAVMPGNGQAAAPGNTQAVMRGNEQTAVRGNALAAVPGNGQTAGQGNGQAAGQGNGGDPEDDRIYEPKKDPILRAAAFVLVPVIILFGIYVILNGHLSPGGGFSGGAIVGAGLILYLSAFGFEKAEKLFTEKTYKIVSFSALTTYCLAKSYSFFTGANHLESHIPLGTPGAILSSGLILLLNICVGMVVACTMYTFYVMFRKGDF